MIRTGGPGGRGTDALERHQGIERLRFEDVPLQTLYSVVDGPVNMVQTPHGYTSPEGPARRGQNTPNINGPLDEGSRRPEWTLNDTRCGPNKRSKRRRTDTPECVSYFH